MSSLAYGPGGASIAIPTGPAPDYNALIQNDPFYKQQVEWLQGNAATQKGRLEAERLLGEQLYNINVQQASQSASGGGGYSGDYGLAAAEERAKLEREAAAHDTANQAEYLREALASRGMVSSGQNAWEQNERLFQYGMQEKQIQADLDARKQAAADAAGAAASANASAQAGLALQLQEMMLRHGGTQRGLGYAIEDLQSDVVRGTGAAAYDTYGRLLGTGALNAPTKIAVWDPTTGLYMDGQGNYYDQNKNPVAKPAGAGGGGGGAPAAPAPAPAPYVYQPPAGVPAPPPPAPIYNPVPGQWGME